MKYDDNRGGGGFFAGGIETGPVAVFQRLDSVVQDALADTMKATCHVVANGGFIVFVGLGDSTRHYAEVAAVESCQGFLGHWQPGVLQNWGTFTSRKGSSNRRLATAIRGLKQGRQFLEMNLSGRDSSSERPDMVFAFDVRADLAAIEEAKNLGIPVAAVVTDPEQAAGVTYALPDDAAHLHSFYAHMIARAAREGITQHFGLLQGVFKSRSPEPRDFYFRDMIMEDWLIKGTLGQPERATSGPISYKASPPESTEDDAAISAFFERRGGGGFEPSDKLVEMVHRGLMGHSSRLGLSPEDLRDFLWKKARRMCGPRILEMIAWRARRIAAGVLPPHPLLANGEFENDFVIELSESIPFRRDQPFFLQLKDELTFFLTHGGSIAGSWGHLKLEGTAVTFVLAAPKAKPASDWEKPSRIEFN